MLGPSQLRLKKKKKKVDQGKEKKKKREEKREMKKLIYPDFINKPIPFYLWSDRVEIWKRDFKLE